MHVSLSILALALIGSVAAAPLAEGAPKFDSSILTGETLTPTGPSILTGETLKPNGPSILTGVTRSHPHNKTSILTG
jgi:hypothetical protein